MAKAADIAKQHIFNTLLERYKDSAVLYDKKLYINIDTGEEVAQIAVSLTAPKNKIDISGCSSVGAVVSQGAAIEKEARAMLDILGLEN